MLRSHPSSGTQQVAPVSRVTVAVGRYDPLGPPRRGLLAEATQPGQDRPIVIIGSKSPLTLGDF